MLTSSSFAPWRRLVVLVVVVLAGCSRGGPLAGAADRTAGAPTQGKAGQNLAYTQSVAVDVAEADLPVVFAAVKAACSQLVDARCEVLDARIVAGRLPNASLRLRATEQGVDTLITRLRTQGEITQQSIQAEDLTGPIADVDRSLAMLADYRTRLEALQARGGNDLDALIKLNHELAQVQVDFDAATKGKATLSKRVETRILEVSLEVARHGSFWVPIAFALTDFGGNFSQGIATAVTGVAYLLPWALLAAVLLWAGRRLLRRGRQVADARRKPHGTDVRGDDRP